jgi:hypothetical protein
MKKYIVLSTAISLLVVTSCAPKFSSAQQQQMTSVNLSQTTERPGAYSSPNFTSRANSSSAGMASGMIGFGLVGALVSEAVIAADRAADASRNRSYTAAIAANPPSNLGPAFDKALRDALAASAFYRSRVSSNPAAPAIVRVNIESYRLSSLDDVQYAPYLEASMSCSLGGKVIFQRKINLQSYMLPNQPQSILPRATMPAYAADTKLLKQHFEQAARILARDAANMLRGAVGEQ